MRVLLDECLPRRLKLAFLGHEAQTVPEAGWAGLKNGMLLSKAATDFDAFVTVDRKIDRELDPIRHPIRVIRLNARTNRLEDLRPLIDRVLAALPQAQHGQVVDISA